MRARTDSHARSSTERYKAQHTHHVVAGRERDRAHRRRVLEHEQLLARLDVPETRGLVCGAGEQARGRDCRITATTNVLEQKERIPQCLTIDVAVVDGTLVAIVRAEALAVVSVPDARLLVLRACEEQIAWATTKK